MKKRLWSGWLRQKIDPLRVESVFLKVQRRNKGKYGDSGCARMTIRGATPE
jgi:hypothetical protein